MENGNNALMIKEHAKSLLENVEPTFGLTPVANRLVNNFVYCHDSWPKMNFFDLISQFSIQTSACEVNKAQNFDNDTPINNQCTPYSDNSVCR